MLHDPKLENAFTILRDEPVPSTLANRLTNRKVERLQHRSRGWSRMSTGLAVAAVVAAAALWPTHRNGSAAWAQVAAASRNQPIVHTIITSVDGHLLSEGWTAGDRVSVNVRDGRTDRIVASVRSDGRIVTSAIDNAYAPTPFGRYIMISRVRPPFKPGGRTVTNPVSGGPNLIDQILNDGSREVARREDVPTPQGRLRQYRLTKDFGSAEHRISATVLVYADPAQGLIRRVETFDRKGTLSAVIVIDYPATVDPAVFRPVRLPGAYVHDVDAERKDLERTLRDGLGKKAGITLRAVMQDENGALHVLWTGGGAPMEDLRAPVRVLGLVTGHLSARKAFTRRYALDPQSKPSPVLGKRLRGMATDYRWHALRRVTLDVPLIEPSGKAKQYVRFQNVPVLRIPQLDSFGDLLGLR